MDINLPDFTGLSLTAVVTLTILLGLIDTVFAWLAAIIQKVFSPTYAADFLLSHGKFWLAITALAVLGHGIAGLGVPAIGIAADAAVAGLAAYAVATIGSLIQNSRSAAVSE